MARRTLFFSIMFALSACSSDSPTAFSMALPTLSVNAADSEIRLSWDTILDSKSYTLCYATQSLGDPANIDNCAAYTNGTLVQNLGIGENGTIHIVTGLSNGTTYYFALVAVDGDSNQSRPSVQVSVSPKKLVISGSGKLNDTGITWGGNDELGDLVDLGDLGDLVDLGDLGDLVDLGDLGDLGGDNTDCSGDVIAQQDCSHGRDVSHNDDSDGHAGFSFTKLDAAGAVLAASASVWRCVQDNVTGLIWEVKTDDDGLHDKNDTYNWYNTNNSTNGGAVGDADGNGNTCEGYVNGQPATYCNTQAFTARVNAAGLCGATDWRLPTRTELRSIVNYATVDPTIDTVYFPNTISAYYWSSFPYANYGDNAWVVNFDNGYDYYKGRNNNNSVRLVGSEQ